VPHRPGLNGRYWQTVEETEADKAAAQAEPQDEVLDE
jgi:hypothetical protein